MSAAPINDDTGYPDGFAFINEETVLRDGVLFVLRFYFHKADSGWNVNLWTASTSPNGEGRQWSVADTKAGVIEHMMYRLGMTYDDSLAINDTQR